MIVISRYHVAALLVAISAVGCTAHDKHATATKTAAAGPAAVAPAGPPSGIIGEATATATAKVVKIDHKARLVTLKGEDGSVSTYHVSEEVRNLPQVKVGDLVTATYEESIAYAVKKPGGDAAPGATMSQGMQRAEPGQKPAAVGARVTTVTATITGIDKRAGTVTLRGPEGNEVLVKARDARNLDRVAIGDLVEVTHTEAVGIAVMAPEKHHKGKKHKN